MALEKPGKLREFFSPTLWPPCVTQYGKIMLMVVIIDMYVVCSTTMKWITVQYWMTTRQTC